VILLCAVCHPDLGSESGVGWTWAKAAAQIADVVLITPTTASRPRIEDEIARLDLPIEVRWVDLPPWALGSAGKLSTGLIYMLWQALAAREVRRCERQARVDVVHHLTFASDSLPSALLASQAPVRVWGPVGGATRTSLGLYRYLTPRGVISEIGRDLMNGTLRATAGSRLARHATLAVALNHDVASRWHGVSTATVIESNTALEIGELDGIHASQPGREPRSGGVALFVGRLIPWKGLLLAVESLAHAPDWKLVVFGEGPDRERAIALADRIGVRDRLEFRGQVPRDQVLEAFLSADALLFPSFHDSASWAVGEAASLGCPVVCLDAGGSRLQAGANAHAVPVQPTTTLPLRLGERLEHLHTRGQPDDHLLANRIPALLKTWYASPPT
jgi:glycosyltransferase involved in cell wall biosynthesis